MSGRLLNVAVNQGQLYDGWGCNHQAPDYSPLFDHFKEKNDYEGTQRKEYLQNDWVFLSVLFGDALRTEQKGNVDGSIASKAAQEQTDADHVDIERDSYKYDAQSTNQPRYQEQYLSAIPIRAVRKYYVAKEGTEICTTAWNR